MDKLRTKLGVALWSLALACFSFSSAPVQSDTCCDPCTSFSFCDAEFTVGVDYLYWKPCVDDLEYAGKSNIIGVGLDTEFKNVCPDWESGYRINLGMKSSHCSSWGLKASVAIVDTDSKASTQAESGPIFATLVHPLLIDLFEVMVPNEFSSLFSFAEAHWSLDYKEWDALFTYEISWSNCQHLTPFLGLAGIHVDQGFKATYLDDDPVEEIDGLFSKWHSDYWGVGLRMGTTYTYQFSNCLSFFAKTHGSILVGEANSNIKYGTIENLENELTIFKSKDEDCSQIVPGYHIGVGISYDSCLCNVDYSFQLGYEFTVWHNIPNHRVFVEGLGFTEVLSEEDIFGNFSLATSTNTQTLGYHGIVAGIQLSF